MEEISNTICKECSEKGETCCIFKLFLTEDEIKILKKYNPELKYKRTKSGFSFVRDKRDSQLKCQFLTDKGCSLPEELKPLDCILFPLVIIYKNSEIIFHLNKDCPCLKFIPKEWIEKTKKQALEKFKTWSEEEKINYSKVAESIPEKKLINI